MRNRIDILSDIYNKLDDWSCPISFFCFIGILVASEITSVPVYNSETRL